MTGSRLLVGVASVLAGTTVLFVVMGFVANPILLLAALPFGAATYFLFSHASGRLDARMRERARRIPPDGAGGAEGRDRARFGPRAPRGRPPPRGSPTGSPRPERVAAARVLGVEPDADEVAVRRAFRERARELHPDAPGGDEAAFKRVRSAYETLRNPP